MAASKGKSKSKPSKGKGSSTVSRSPVKEQSSASIGDVKDLVKDVAGDLNKKFGAGSAMIMSGEEDGQEDMLEIPFWIRTGLPALDYAIGGPDHPGVPGGRIIEIFGPESNGKTTVALWLLGKLLETGGIGVYQDTECALSEERAEQMGIDMSGVVYSQPETMEEVFQQQEAVIEKLSSRNSDTPVGIFWDSIASSPTQSEVDGEFGDAVMGIHARIMSQSLRKIRRTIKKQKILAVFINQIRDKVGVVYGDKTATFGGRAMKFYSSVRIQVTQIEKIKKNDEIIGIKVRADVKKNKVYAPFKSAEFRILFFEGHGIDQAGAIIEWLKEKDFLGDEKGYYVMLDGKKRRFDDAREQLLDDEDLFQEYLDLCYTV